MRPLGIALAAALLAACTKTGQVGPSAGGSSGGSEGRANAYTTPHVLRIGDTQDFDNLNPHLSTSLILGNLNQLTMAYLVRYDHHNQPTPELATEVPTEENGGGGKKGLTLNSHLRHG